MELKANLIRPRPWRIGVDCDNVINNLVESIINVYNKDYNDNLSVADITTYNMRQFLKMYLKTSFMTISRIRGYGTT